MRSTARHLARIGLVILVTSVSADADAQDATTLSTQDLRTWIEQFPVPGSQLQEVLVARAFPADEELRPFSGQAVVGLGINGRVQFTSPRALVRIVMVDNQSQEHLVYETYPLIAASESFEIRTGCRETCLMSPTVPSALRVELIDAWLDIQTIVINQLITAASVRAAAAQTTEQMQEVKAAQETEVIEALNRQIRAMGLKWIAGETPVSRLPYAERKRLLACLAPPDTPPGLNAPANLQGAEYYVGGVLDLRSPEATSPAVAQAASALVDSFDWRSRHGANRPGSPYYDGDPSGGGWMTSVKSQRCADCWAHSALGTTEALANLYFNQHIDLDLSEQELVSCSGAGTCASGGNTGLALHYVTTAGVVDEACFPESGLDEPCTNCCSAPQERVRIYGWSPVDPRRGEDHIKSSMIRFGPLAFGIASWWHGMVLVGYTTEAGTGDTIWIVKNSWGDGWGNHGYGYVKVGLNDIYLTYYALTPVFSEIAGYTVACRDEDGDGYLNWGLSLEGSVACGSVTEVEDCDDSDPTLALMTEAGACIAPPALDNTAPAIALDGTPSILWPPNGMRVAVTVTGTITDTESGVNADTLTYTVIDEYARIQPSGQIALETDGSFSFTVWLQARRRGDDSDGRHYAITIAAQDVAGNSQTLSSTLTVPHDRRK
jgi:hypothetical protein